MSIVAPTRYGTPKTPGISREGGGFVVTCWCRWLRFYETEKDAAEGQRKHAKGCARCKAREAVAA